METALSEEIVYDMPPGDPDLQIAFNAQRQVTLTAANVAQGSFRILATSDLVQWSPLATVMTDSNGTIRFTDTTAGVVPVSRRFYRLEKVAP